MSNPTELPDLDTVIAYLLGEGPLIGRNFGDKPLDGTPYWWRAYLRAAARRAQPEGEAPQADMAQLPTGLEFDGYHDSDEHYGKTILDLVRSRLEVDPDELQEGDVFYVSASWVQPQEWRVVRAGNPLEVERISPPAAPAATLPPLCGAQHAESGKEVAVPGWEQRINAVAPALRVKTKDQAMEAEITAWRALAAQQAAPCPYCGGKDGQHDRAYPHPLAAQLDGGQGEKA